MENTVLASMAVAIVAITVAAVLVGLARDFGTAGGPGRGGSTYL